MGFLELAQALLVGSTGEKEKSIVDDQSRTRLFFFARRKLTQSRSEREGDFSGGWVRHERLALLVCSNVRREGVELESIRSVKEG